MELEANLEERLLRNKSPHRLQEKSTKRSVERSEKDLLNTYEKYRLNSMDGEIKRENYIRINNTNLSPVKAAKVVLYTFKL